MRARLCWPGPPAMIRKRGRGSFVPNSPDQRWFLNDRSKVLFVKVGFARRGSCDLNGTATVLGGHSLP